MEGLEYETIVQNGPKKVSIFFLFPLFYLLFSWNKAARSTCRNLCPYRIYTYELFVGSKRGWGDVL